MEYPYERAAMRGEEMPDGLEFLDQLNFLALRDLYSQARQGIITRETGSREKGKLTYQHGLLERKLRTKEGLVKRSVEMLVAVEHYANKYAKDRTLEHADELYHALYGVYPSKEADK